MIQTYLRDLANKEMTMSKADIKPPNSNYVIYDAVVLCSINSAHIYFCEIPRCVLFQLLHIANIIP